MQLIGKFVRYLENREAQTVRQCTPELNLLAAALHDRVRDGGRHFNCQLDDEDIEVTTFGSTHGDRFMSISRNGRKSLEFRLRAGHESWRWSAAAKSEADRAITMVQGMIRLSTPSHSESPSM